MSSSMFRSFSIFNYRVWFIGALVSNVGQWMQGTALSWVVLTQLTHNDAGAMGITMALQFAPPLLLVGVTGWVADRFDRRRLVMLTQSLLLVIGAVIGVLILRGVMTLPLMYLFAFVLGLVAAFDWDGAKAEGVSLEPGAALADADTVVRRVEPSYMVLTSSGGNLGKVAKGSSRMISLGSCTMVAMN